MSYRNQNLQPFYLGHPSQLLALEAVAAVHICLRRGTSGHLGERLGMRTQESADEEGCQQQRIRLEIAP